MSLRYLHAIVKEHGMTVNECLIKRRLAWCMDELLSPMAAARTITEIACSNGFKTSAHFSRRFVEAYGRSPRDAKQNGLPGGLLLS